MGSFETLAKNWLLDNPVLGLGIVIFLLMSLRGIFKRKRQDKSARKILEKAIKSGSNEPSTLHPEVNTALCAGCTACTTVCPEGDILQMINHKAVLVAPSKCVGHGDCEAACPTGAITLVFGTKTRGMDIPRISRDYETNVPGLYIAGELGGMGLIRNAIKQGNFAAEHALSNLKSADKADVDLFIVGAGPAGLAAALTAIAQKKSYVCIDQNTFGGTVANFPRQKLVTSRPAALPLVGTMKFPKDEVTKEELIEYWQSVRSKTGLKVKEKTRFENLAKKGNLFEVTTSGGSYTAKKVVLAMGVRGSPRRLGLPNEDLPKVAYNLEDPSAFKGQEIAIVGGGNAAVEAAQYLAKRELGNKVRLLVRGKVLDRCNDENKARLNELVDAGLVKLQFESSISSIEKATVKIKTSDHEESVKNTALFVFAGADVPFKFLMGLGIKIDKKFGEAAGSKP